MNKAIDEEGIIERRHNRDMMDLTPPPYQIALQRVAVGSKRLRIVELGTPYKRPMSSSGRLSVDVMMG
ncbi:jg12740 [Pararge aegeria aegeria]|uniref:Jg12740 protein n=1 Tax=Pararge aegeria aegeria TaxID=348720 RepID=A0A8S4S8P4_9NEOP|nr:jg12740 [Pararge aegeria aegeria]